MYSFNTKAIVAFLLVWGEVELRRVDAFAYACKTAVPDEECGISEFSAPCSQVVKTYDFGGTCCSLRDVGGNKCVLTVNGPGSSCTFSRKSDQEYQRLDILATNRETCPPSKYQVVPKIQSQLQVCMEGSFDDCSMTCLGGMEECWNAQPGRSLKCVKQTYVECEGVAGSPTEFACSTLETLRAARKVPKASCLKYTAKCSSIGYALNC
jgi:hypothetical protein